MKKTNKKVRLSRIEKLLIKFCFVLLLSFPIANVLSKAALSDMNMKVEELKTQINVQKNSNESLTMKVNELKSLANIEAIASSEGLSYNSNNIKVITNN
jgi:cell division protein FtsL